MGALIPAYVDRSFVLESDSPYEFDFDINGALALTPNNVVRVRFLINNDSDYRSEIDLGDINPARRFCEENPQFWNNERLTTELVEIIDKANSTHQASEGRAGGNRGREKTAEAICRLADFGDRIQACDPTLVDEIADSLENRYTFSFASKFCAYVSRALSPDASEQDGYSIYDLIVRSALPYYAATYLGDLGVKIRKRNGKCPVDPYGKFGDKRYKESEEWKYEKYSRLIEQIINSNEKKIGYRISRQDFDYLLWYYYKGDDSRREEIRALVLQDGPELLHEKFLESEDCSIKATEWMCHTH